MALRQDRLVPARHVVGRAERRRRARVTGHGVRDATRTRDDRHRFTTRVGSVPVNGRVRPIVDEVRQGPVVRCAPTCPRGRVDLVAAQTLWRSLPSIVASPPRRRQYGPALDCLAIPTRVGFVADHPNQGRFRARPRAAAQKFRANARNGINDRGFRARTNHDPSLEAHRASGTTILT
jgi:hypothetical protein